MTKKVNNTPFIVKSFLKETFKTHAQYKIGCVLFLSILLVSCSTPKEEIKFLRIKDVVVDGTSDPKLKAEVFFFNPNDIRMKLKKIDIEIYYEGKRVGKIDQKLSTVIPAKEEFSIGLEVNLAIKELNIVNTLLSMIGGKSMEIQYKGYLKLNYHGFPVHVPVDFKDNIRVRF